MVNNPLRALHVVSFRWFFASTLLSLSNIWMIRIAQSWLVLSVSGGSGVALGVATALQFLPTLALTPWAGVLVDRLPKLRVLVIAEICLTVLVVIFAVITTGGMRSLTTAYCLIFAIGLCSAFVAPARLALPADTMTDSALASAISLVSNCSNLGRLVGPALAGALLAAGSVSHVFQVSAGICALVLAALLPARGLSVTAKAERGSRGALRTGLRYVKGRPDLLMVMIGAFFITAFGWNSNVLIALIAREVFGLDGSGFAFLSAAFAAGSVLGALVAGALGVPSMARLGIAATFFGVSTAVVMASSTPIVFGALLIVQAVGSITVATLANVYVQSTVPTWVRGRVLSLFVTLTTGSAPIGAPLLGVIADAWGPWWCYGVSGAVTLTTVLVCTGLVLRSRAART